MVPSFSQLRRFSVGGSAILLSISLLLLLRGMGGSLVLGTRRALDDLLQRLDLNLEDSILRRESLNLLVKSDEGIVHLGKRLLDGLLVHKVAAAASRRRRGASASTVGPRPLAIDLEAHDVVDPVVGLVEPLVEPGLADAHLVEHIAFLDAALLAIDDTDGKVAADVEPLARRGILDDTGHPLVAIARLAGVGVDADNLCVEGVGVSAFLDRLKNRHRCIISVGRGGGRSLGRNSRNKGSPADGTHEAGSRRR